MWKRALLGVAMAAAWTAAARADELSLGDPAPKLEVKEFLKGSPVKTLQKGKTYVVEFWATWCGPCRATIPHLTKLQKKHKDVTFIGISVYEQDQKSVKAFVDEMGDKMDYVVALDSVPANGSGGDGKMAKAWMDAADQEGIPTAFIVNGQGKVAWIGHPMDLEKPLEKILSGSYDLKVEADKFKKEHAAQRKMRAKMRELQGKLLLAQKSQDRKAMVAIIDDAVAEVPELEEQLGLLKYRSLIEQGDAKEKAVQYGKRLINELLKENAGALNNVAWLSMQAKGKKVDPELAKLALTAAKKADEVSGGAEPGILDTLAKAYFENGQAAKALETQEKAVKLAKGTALEKNEEMEHRLEQYRKAVKEVSKK